MTSPRPLVLIIIIIIIGWVTMPACVQPPSSPPPTRSTSSTKAYAPGLGEMMTLQQMRHTKLWLAGQAGNWDLAAYEIKELGERFAEVLVLHPKHEETAL